MASTKAYTTQLLCLNLLGIFFAQELQVLSEDRRKALVSELLEVPRLVEKVLTTEAKIKELAEDFRNKENIFFIGRGLDYAVAQECSLKLNEISYIHAEA